MDSIAAPLKGKVAIITGGSRGIGAGIARRFAEHGCSHIAITYSKEKAKAEEVLASIRQLHPDIKTCTFSADLLDAEFGPKVVKQAMEELGTTHVDIVVANASLVDVHTMVAPDMLTKQHFDTTMAGVAWAAFSLATAAIGHMPPGGRIIMMSSAASKLASGGLTTAYSAGKAALESITRNLAAEWSVKHGITVNSISVGMSCESHLSLRPDLTLTNVHVNV